jgi:hypothetical protein
MVVAEEPNGEEGRCGRGVRLRMAVWVEWMVVQLGRRTEIPGLAMVQLECGVVIWM